MKFFKFTSVLLLFFALSQVSVLFAEDTFSDSLDIPDDDVKFSFSKPFAFDHPTVEVIYGNGSPMVKSFLSDFSKVSSLEARFGFTTYEPLDNDSSLLEYNFNYFFIGNNNSMLIENNEESSSQINTDSWRFGFAWSDGQGYKIGEKTNIVFYQTDAWAWTKTRLIDSINNPKEQFKMNNLGDDFRFGDYYEGGIKFQIYEPFAINLSYQRGIVMPRHLFWYWLASGTIERGGDYLVGWFTDKISEASPTFGPIAYFILHNAYSYGFYELRKSKMNWPFNTTEPLMYDGFNVGMTFTF